MDKKLLKLKQQQELAFTGISQILSGLASPVRIKLVHFLSQSPLTVETLATKIDQSVANTSMHLRKMLGENIVSVSVQGQKRLYSLHPAAFIFWEACQNFSQEVSPSTHLDIENTYEEMNWTENLKTTVKMIKNNEVVLLDARPPDEALDSLAEFNSINIPSSEIKKNINKLPKKKPVLVFCRGRLCALSAYVVNELKENGVKAYRLNESWYALKEAL